jgi:hypothetical protein
MNVHGPTLIPPGKDGEKISVPMTIGRLIAAKESAFSGRLRCNIRVNAGCIAVPDVNICSGQRHGVTVDELRHINCERQRKPRLD